MREGAGEGGYVRREVSWSTLARICRERKERVLCNERGSRRRWLREEEVSWSTLARICRG